MVSDEIGHPKRRKFLAAIAECASITRACGAAGIARATHYNWLKEDPDYKAQFDEAFLRGIDSLESEAMRRAQLGTRKPVYQGGKLVGYVQEYSDSLMAKLLTGRRRDVYGDKIVHSGDPNDPVKIEVAYVHEPPKNAPDSN